MLQFSFSTNGFVTKPDWTCVEMPVTVFLENAILHTPIGMCQLIPVQELFSNRVSSTNFTNKDQKHNLWMYKNINHQIHVMVFKDYHKRTNNTYQIPAQTDCVAATTNDTWVAPLDDMNVLTLDINHINHR